MEDKKVFWLDNYVGEAVGGFLIRNMLKDFFDTLSQQGLNPVGIVYDGSYNLEILIEKNQSYIDKYEYREIQKEEIY